MAASVIMSRRALQIITKCVQNGVRRQNRGIPFATSEQGIKSFPWRCSCPSVKLAHTFSTVATSEQDQEVEEDSLYRKLLIEVKGHDVEVINSYQRFLQMTARELDLKITNITTPPKVFERHTLLKSVHIYKKHRVQYEFRTHFRTIELKHLTGSTAETFLEYIQRNLPEGIAMKVTKHRLEALPSHLKPPTQEQPNA